MNHQIPQFNPNVPLMNHTDWASMAKQWATLRANVNIPPSVNIVENYSYHNIPPPPPPPNIVMQKPNHMSYNNDYQSTTNPDTIMSFNHSISNIHSNFNNNIYETSMHPMYDDMSSNMNSHCETFDYNHRDRPFVNYNNTNTYRPQTTFTQNIFNLPPPTHQDYVETKQMKPFYPEPTPPKLFPIINTEEYNIKHQPQITANIISAPIKQNLAYTANKFDTHSDFSTNRSNKGLPAWIIDDMKKIKEKEKKQPFTSMDDFRDHPINSKRDEEGDIVMEDVIKETDNDFVLSGKSVITTDRIDNMPTDIDDVVLIDDDDDFDKVDYSSKSLIDLIEMLDEADLDNLKIIIIRESLTGVMKQVTDDMISEVVNSTFTKELSKLNSHSKIKTGITRDCKTVNCISDESVKPIDPPSMDYQIEPVCHLLGLDVYESDDENVQNIESINETNEKKSVSSAGRERWSSHKKDNKMDSKKSINTKDEQISHLKENKKSTPDNNSSKNPSPKRKKKSKSKERNKKESKSSHERHRSSRSPDNRHKSRSKDRHGSSSHKKSKKHNHSPDSSRDNNRWKNDKCDQSSIIKKRRKHDRSRS